MKIIPTELLRTFFRDRTMASLVAGVFLVGTVYSIYLLTSLEQSDLQVATRYTAFGDTHFYRSKWYYLLSFAAFAGTLSVLHVALAIKLYGMNRRQLAVALLGFTFLVFIIGWIIMQSVLQIAFL